MRGAKREGQKVTGRLRTVGGTVWWEVGGNLVGGWVLRGIEVWPRRAWEIKGKRGKNKLSEEEKEWAILECEALMEEGTLEECGEDGVDYVSGIRLVPKRPGDEDRRKWYRMVVRMMGLNEHCVERRFKLPKLEELHGLDPEGDYWAFTLDLKSAYHHLELSPQARRWMGIRVGGRTWRFRGLPFGFSLAPWIFCTVMKKVVEWLRGLEEMSDVIILYFFDDLLFVGKGRERMEGVRTMALERLRALGWLLSEDKGDPVGKTVTFTGFLIDFGAMEWRLTEEKAERYGRRTKRLLESWARRLGRGKGKGVWVSGDAFRSTLGQLVHAAQVVWQMRPFLRSAHARNRDRGNVWLGWEVVQDWREAIRWLERVQQEGAVFGWRERKEVVEIESDASGVRGGGWGIVWRGKGWALGGRWEEEVEGEPVAYKELLAVEKAIELWGREWKGQQVRFKVDSMNVTSFWRRGGALKSKLKYAEVMKRVIRMLGEFKVKMVDVAWIPRELNVLADKLSKLHLGTPSWVRRSNPWDEGWRSEDWGLVAGLKEAVLRSVGRVDVDAFASLRSSMADIFYGPSGAVGSGREAAEAEEWDNPQARVWACPPLRLASQALRLVEESRASVVLVLPVWRRSVWWWRVRRLELTRAECWGIWKAKEVVEKWEGSEWDANDSWEVGVWLVRDSGGKR